MTKRAAHTSETEDGADGWGVLGGRGGVMFVYKWFCPRAWKGASKFNAELQTSEHCYDLRVIAEEVLGKEEKKMLHSSGEQVGESD